jgi:hypothetical protein
MTLIMALMVALSTVGLPVKIATRLGAVGRDRCPQPTYSDTERKCKHG